MSFEAIQKKQIKKVFYNEFNTGVTPLLKDIFNNGVTDKYYKWIARETFNDNKNGNDWMGGLCKTVWSFGSNQRYYIFGKDIEEDKRILHEIIINRCEKSLFEFNNKFNTFISINNNKSLFEEENKDQLRHRISKEISNLQHLQHCNDLEISNYSYEDVIVDTPISETIVYLDPPYENTSKYECDISHKDLYKYIRDSKYKIYMSSYKSDLQCVHEIEHRSSISSSANNLVIEKLFCNKTSKSNTKKYRQKDLF